MSNIARVVFLLLISLSTFANECVVTAYFIPPAKRIDWSSSASVMKSSLKSYHSAFSYSFSDIARKSVGHAVISIETPDELRWTSISINSFKTIPAFAKNGVSGIFTPTRGAHIQSKRKVQRFIKNNRENLLFIKIKSGSNSCKRIASLDEKLRKRAKKRELYFNPTSSNLFVNGGTGTSYAVHLLKDLGVKIPSQWKQSFKDKNEQTYSFYETYNIWQWISIQKSKSEATIKLGRKSITLQGISIH